MIAYTIKNDKKYFIAQGEQGEIWDLVTQRLQSLEISVVVRYLDGDHCPISWGYIEELI